MTAFPREAREGLMRAWLKVLNDRHPQVTWVPVDPNLVTTTANAATVAQPKELATSA
jgi:hypothetical protein